VRLRQGIATIGVLAVLAGACGGGSSSNTVTVTAAGSSAEQSAPPTTVDLQAQLDGFLNGVRPLREEGNAAVDDARHALDAIDSNDTSGWPEIGDRIEEASKTIGDLTDRLASQVPPDELSQTWSGYVAAFQQEASVLQDLAEALKKKSASDVLDWKNVDLPRLTKAADQTLAFKIALLQYASKNGLHVPDWVHSIGKK
jgi:hypothetical protein